jgi:hypothetical protein
MKQNIVPPKKIEVKEATVSSVKTSNADSLPFGKKNYTLMLIGLAMILGGFFIMTLDKEEFGFGFLGITLGPALAFVGFMFQFYAILKRK